MELDGSPVGADELAALALYNYGHFTSMRVEHMKVRGLSLHMKRLVDDSNEVHGKPVDPARVRDLVKKALAGGPQTAVARVTVFAPDLDLAHPDQAGEPRVLVTTKPVAESDNVAPMRVKSVLFRRDLPLVKHVGLFGQVSHRRAAQRQGFDDAVFVDEESTFMEGATWNIGFLRGDDVVWPDGNCLVGVTMRLLRDALNSYDMGMKTEQLRLSDLDSVESAFATNAAIGVRPICAIDDHELAVDGRTLKEIREAYLSTPPEPL
jgi:branched-subunit amino acid aminotransferase/4-amino-4-deoxychorismate lyase